MALFLDEQNDLTFSVGDNRVVIPAEYMAPYYNKRAMYLFGAIMHGDELTIQLEVENATKAFARASYTGPVTFDRQTFGGGEAHFGEAESVWLDSMPDEDWRQNMLGYLRREYPTPL